MVSPSADTDGSSLQWGCSQEARGPSDLVNWIATLLLLEEHLRELDVSRLMAHVQREGSGNVPVSLGCPKIARRSICKNGGSAGAHNFYHHLGRLRTFRDASSCLRVRRVSGDRALACRRKRVHAILFQQRPAEGRRKAEDLAVELAREGKLPPYPKLLADDSTPEALVRRLEEQGEPSGAIQCRGRRLRDDRRSLLARCAIQWRQVKPDLVTSMWQTRWQEGRWRSYDPSTDAQPVSPAYAWHVKYDSSRATQWKRSGARQRRSRQPRPGVNRRSVVQVPLAA
jgi:hypothetical protein